MDKIPDYLIERYIIQFLSPEDLFYKFRCLGSYYYNCAKNEISINVPIEIVKALHRINEFGIEEVVTKEANEIAQKRLLEKRNIFFLIQQFNYSMEIKLILENTRDERALRLIDFFYVITKNESKQNLARQEKYDEIQQLAGEEESILETYNKLGQVCHECNIDYNIVYSALDREFLRNNNFTKKLYDFVSLFLKYSVTRIKLSEMVQKIKNFCGQLEGFLAITEKYDFYQKVINFVEDTQLLSSEAK